MSIRRILAAAAVLAFMPLAALAADISGTWATSFDSQVGVQAYTYTFVVKGADVTGTFKSANGAGAITEGKLAGDKLTFVENMDYQGQALRIVYTGTVVSADEIKFSRDVGGQGGESFTAKRVK
jgi:hypothetical protein